MFFLGTPYISKSPEVSLYKSIEVCLLRQKGQTSSVWQMHDSRRVGYLQSRGFFISGFSSYSGTQQQGPMPANMSTFTFVAVNPSRAFLTMSGSFGSRRIRQL